MNPTPKEVVDFIARLKLEGYHVYRRIVAPIDMTFEELHSIMQIVFAWYDYHLYDFILIDKRGKIVEYIESKKFKNKIPFKEYFKNGYKIIYRYDFKDNWRHEISIRKIYKDEKVHPICLLGEGITPPEEVGGASGYERFLEILSNPEEEEYESVMMWAKFQGYKPFDIEIVNKRLRTTFEK